MSDEPIRLLTEEERKAVESARTMTPLTLLMVVDTIKAEARREGAAEVAARVMKVLQPGCFGGLSPDVDPYDIHSALFRDDA